MQVSQDEAYEDACSKRHDNWSQNTDDLWGYDDEENEE